MFCLKGCLKHRAPPNLKKAKPLLESVLILNWGSYCVSFFTPSVLISIFTFDSKEKKKKICSVLNCTGRKFQAFLFCFLTLKGVHSKIIDSGIRFLCCNSMSVLHKLSRTFHKLCNMSKPWFSNLLNGGSNSTYLRRLKGRMHGKQRHSLTPKCTSYLKSKRRENNIENINHDVHTC